MTSELKVDKITPASGTNTQIGEAGDTTNLSAGTVTLPTSIITGATEKTSLVDADKFLISDSADSNAFKHVQKSNMPSGNLVKLLSSSQSDGNAAQIYGTNIFNSTYDNYLLTGFIAPTQDSEIRFRWTTGGGTTQFTNADYNWVSTTRNIDSSHGTGNSYGGYHGESYFPIAFEDVNADSDSDAANFHMLISDPSTSILSRPYITGTSTYRSIATAKLYTERFGFAMEGNPSATGFILYMSAGNIRDHSICVYGYKK